MRGPALYLRSRRVPLALTLAAVSTAIMWSLWSYFSNAREVPVPVVLLTILIVVATVTAPLSGPDDELDHTAALSWPPRRAAHLTAALAVVLLPVLATLLTGARFGPSGVVLRDAAGLLGLTAMAAVTLGVARAWIPSLAWTLLALAAPLPETAWARVIAWQIQEPGHVPAAMVAALLAVGGLIAYAVTGPARSAPAEAAL